MDVDLNRAVTPQRFGAVAFFVGSSFLGTLIAGELDSLAFTPQRIGQAPPPAVRVSKSVAGSSSVIYEPDAENLRTWQRTSTPAAPIQYKPSENTALEAPMRLQAAKLIDSLGQRSVEISVLSRSDVPARPVSIVEPVSTSPPMTIPTASPLIDPIPEPRWLEGIPVAATRSDTNTRAVRGTPAMALPGFSVGALRFAAAQSLDEAALALSRRASMSAADAATDSLRKLTQAIDLQTSSNVAGTRLAAALTAMWEAEDFVGRYGTVDSVAISRMVRSHETPVLKGIDASGLSGIAAADHYMNFARRALGSIAKADPLCPHALAMLAKSYRQRADESPIALAASVHLMRAAAQSASDDLGITTELASVLRQANLPGESAALQDHAEGLATSRPKAALDSDEAIEIFLAAVASGNQSASQAVKVQQISPEMFAGISRSEAGPMGNVAVSSLGTILQTSVNNSAAVTTTANQTPPTFTSGIDVSLASRIDAPPTSGADQSANPLKRTLKSMTRLWR